MGEGFISTGENVEVTIVFSQKEYHELWKELQEEGMLLPKWESVSEIIRQKLGLQPEVYGRNRPVKSEAYHHWLQDGKKGPMPE